MKKELLLNTNSGDLYFARRIPRKTTKQSRYVRVWTKLGRVVNIRLP